eukprot:3372255-Ditylum_brightwellii.AAC.2
MKWSQKCTIVTPLSTLCTNYNVQAKIDEVLSKLELGKGKRYQIQHIKGHQKGDNLSREAELNNAADKLATQARKTLTWSQQNTKPPLYPASKIAVTINGQIITRGLEQELHQAYTSIDMREYLKHKFQWDKSTTGRVD